MKKMILVFTLITAAAFAVFAEGSQEDNTWTPGTGYMGRGYNTDQNNWGPAPMGRRPGYSQNGWNPGYGANQAPAQESASYTGTVTGLASGNPVLETGDKTYELMVPYRMDYTLEIKDGDEITIKGFEVPAYRRSENPDTNNLMVTGAVFNGTEYDLNQTFGKPSGYAPGMGSPRGAYSGRPAPAGRYPGNMSYGRGMQPGNNWNNNYYCPRW